MTYAGATAGSTSANPPQRIAGGLGGISEQSTATGGGRGVWLYNSSHSTTQMTDTSFFTDAYYLGMQAGDIVMGANCTGSSIAAYMGVLGTVTTAGAALASTGGILSSTR
jgi:hypothetical protein